MRLVVLLLKAVIVEHALGAHQELLTILGLEGSYAELLCILCEKINIAISSLGTLHGSNQIFVSVSIVLNAAIELRVNQVSV